MLGLQNIVLLMHMWDMKSAFAHEFDDINLRSALKQCKMSPEREFCWARRRYRILNATSAYSPYNFWPESLERA